MSVIRFYHRILFEDTLDDGEFFRTNADHEGRTQGSASFLVDLPGFSRSCLSLWRLLFTNSTLMADVSLRTKTACCVASENLCQSLHLCSNAGDG